MNSCEEEIKKLESQIQDTDAKLEAIMSANSKAQKWTGRLRSSKRCMGKNYRGLLQMKSCS